MTTVILPHIAASAAYIPGLQPQAGGTKLNTNELPFAPSPRVAQAIARAAVNLNRYPQASASELTQAAAQVYGVNADHVLACNGADEALAATIRAIVSPGDVVATLSPTYPLYATIVAQQGGSWRGLAFDGFEASCLQQVKLSLITRPNSPCGRIIDREVIATWPGFLVVDEAYVEFGADSVVDLLAKKRDLLVVRTLSKAYGIAGLRVGFLLGDPELLQEIAKLRGVYTVDRVAAAAGIAALSDQDYLRQSTAAIARLRRQLVDELQREGAICRDLPVNFVWLPTSRAKAIAAELAASQVYVRPFNEGLRVTVGTQQDHEIFLRHFRQLELAL